MDTKNQPQNQHQKRDQQGQFSGSDASKNRSDSSNKQSSGSQDYSNRSDKR